MKELIKSPLNYTGNKYRILDQVLPHFPQQIGIMVDLFCGGATVGINTNCKKCIFIDSEPRVIGLLKFIHKSDFDVLLKKLEKIIIKYKLSYSYKYTYKFYSKMIKDNNLNNGLKQYNSIGFYQLRDDYNMLENKNTNDAYAMLYILMVYGFNNDLRFNSNGEYNLPVGKTDLNKSNIMKLKEFINKTKTMDVEFVCADFRDSKVQKIINNADFVYMDPPYLITNAVYNETSGWNEDIEWALLNMLDRFIVQNKKFVLSNVISKKGRINEPLSTWTKARNNKIKLINIDYHYRGASYNKIERDSNEQEIIVVYEGK